MTYLSESLDLFSEINDPDNIIIIGSPNWSQDVDIAAADPVEGTNLMYTLHFYAGSHGQELRDKMDANMISWCNWSIGSSIAEKSNALKMNSDLLTPQEKSAAHWPDNFLTSSGIYVRSKLLDIPYTES